MRIQDTIANVVSDAHHASKMVEPGLMVYLFAQRMLVEHNGGETPLSTITSLPVCTIIFFVNETHLPHRSPLLLS